MISNILLKNGIITEDDKEIYEYGSFVFVFNLLIMLAGAAIAFLLKELKFMIFFFLFFIPLRMFIGGYHRKTPQSCFVLSELFFLIIILMYKYLETDFMIFYVFLFTLIASIDNLIQSSSANSKSGIIGMIIFSAELVVCLIFPEFRTYVLYAWLSATFLYYLKKANDLICAKKMKKTI